METVKQIVYREEDGVLMIVANNENLAPTPRFLKDLTVEQKATIEALRTFVLTKIDVIKYVVYTAENNHLYLEPTEGDSIPLFVTDLGEDKPIVDSVGLMCTQLLNS